MKEGFSTAGQHLPARRAAEPKENFYRGGATSQPSRADQAATSGRLYNDWLNSHRPRMPFYDGRDRS